MTKWLRIIVVACCIAAPLTGYSDELPPPDPMTSKRFALGQVWLYKTRPTEPDSRVLIGKVESTPELGTIVHVKLVGLRIKSPSAPGEFGSVMSHVPITEAALNDSATQLTNEQADLSGFSDGYNNWLTAYQAGDAGVFTLSLADVVDTIEEALNQ